MPQSGAGNLPSDQPGDRRGMTAAATWAGVNVLLAAWGVFTGGWLAGAGYDLPARVLVLLLGSLAASAVTLIWCLWLTVLALRRSPRFAKQFIVWQSVIIVWILLREAYVLAAPDFVLAPGPMAFAAAEIAVGLACIRLLTRAPAAAAGPSRDPPPVIASIAAGAFGILLGGALGGAAGLLGGSLYADAAGMSCFEGACGYFAVMIGLAGAAAGAVAGGILAVRLLHRSRPAPGAAA